MCGYSFHLGKRVPSHHALCRNAVATRRSGFSWRCWDSDLQTWRCCQERTKQRWRKGMTTDMFICKPNFILLSVKQKQGKSPEQTTSCFGRAHSKPKPCPQELQTKQAKRKKTMVDFGLLISCKSTQSYFTKNLSNINEILESDGYQFLLVYLTCYAWERSNHGSVERSTNATKLAC